MKTNKYGVFSTLIFVLKFVQSANLMTNPCNDDKSSSVPAGDFLLGQFSNFMIMLVQK